MLPVSRGGLQWDSLESGSTGRKFYDDGVGGNRKGAVPRPRGRGADLLPLDGSALPDGGVSGVSHRDRQGRIFPCDAWGFHKEAVPHMEEEQPVDRRGARLLQGCLLLL